MDELKKSIESHQVAQQIQVESLGNVQVLEKSTPIGTINKYGYRKMQDGSWQYVKKENEKKEKEPEKLYEQILKAIQPTVDRLVELYKEAFLKQFKQVMKPTHIQMIELQVKAGLMRSIENYTKLTDRLINLSSHSSNGQIIVSASIEREGKLHYLSTSVIHAGGYNIQSLHLRYLTNTTLPRTGNQEETNKIEEKIKKLTRVEKLEKDKEEYDTRINKYQEELKVNRSKTDDEIKDILRKEKYGSWIDIKYEDLDPNSYAAKSGKEYWDSERVKSIKNLIESWKRMNIESKQRTIDSLSKGRSKIITKLNELKDL